MTRSTMGGCAVAALLAAVPAAAQVAPDAAPLPAPAASRADRYVQPYIELTQVVTADLVNGNDDVLTYSQVAAGIDAGVQTQRTQAQISYRYERRIDWGSDVGDDDIHSGLARVGFNVTPALTLEAGALATRTRSDIRGAAPGNLAGNVDNISQVYSLYAGPSLSTSSGPVQINAGYLFGYTKAEAPTYQDSFFTPLDTFDESVNHLAQASIGVPAGRVAPFGVTVSGAYERDDADQLDQSYEGWFARGDVTLPVSRTLALRAGAGYEKIEAKQRDALVDGTGTPVTDEDGRFVTDQSSPARIAYDTDGLIYDAGVIWRPSPRLELQANAGYRYGGETYFGSLNWAVSRNAALQVVVYDGIETFGRQLRDSLSDLPTAFVSQPDPFGQQFNGCVFGQQGGTGAGAVGAGGCLNDVFQSLSTATYRARGVDAVYSFGRGRSTFGVGGGYANRRLYAPDRPNGLSIDGLEDQSAYANLFYSYNISRTAVFDANLLGSWYASGLPGSADVYGLGANASLSKNFGRLGTMASLGVFGFDDGTEDEVISAQALLGARYTF